MKKIFALGLLAAACGIAQAETAELSVVGKIIPPACKPVIANNGRFDFGNISPTVLSATAPTALGAVAQAFTIDCDAATKMAVKITDNQSGTAAGGKGAGYDFGLGGTNTGSYTVGLYSTSGDVGAVDVLTDSTGAGAWVTHGQAGADFKADGTGRLSFANTGSSVPAAYKSVGGLLMVKPTINSLSQLDLGAGLELSGSATIEVTYL